MYSLKYPKIFDQNNPAWAKELLGFNTDPKFTIGSSGCLLTCLAMVCQYFNFDEDPDTLNKKLKEVNSFINGGDYIWGSITKVYPQIQEKNGGVFTKPGFKIIKKAIDKGKPVILEIDSNPEDSEFESHFVLVSSYNPKGSDSLEIIDPSGGKIHSIKDYLGEGGNIFGLVKQYIIYTLKV